MPDITKTALYGKEDNEFLGFLVHDSIGWQAQTIFGYTIARTTNRKEAEEIINQQGASYLQGIWQYFDKDERNWFPCVIKEAIENRVTVIRTNEMGYQDSDSYKLVIIKHPTDETLIKSS